MKEYKTEIIAIIFLGISYILSNGLFFSFDSLGFFENWQMKSAISSAYKSIDLQQINQIKVVYMPALAIALFLYSIFGKSQKKFLLIAFFYLALYLAKPIIEYHFMDSLLRGEKISFSYFKYILLILFCLLGLGACNQTREERGTHQS